MIYQIYSKIQQRTIDFRVALRSSNTYLVDLE